MNVNLCKLVVAHKHKLIPQLFTKAQVGVLKKYLANQQLSASEKSYLYGPIKKKLDALQLFSSEWVIQGSDLIPSRVRQAKQILQKLGYEKAFISGSFLYKNTYQDIDVFVVGKRAKPKQIDKYHIHFISEQDLQQPLYYSLYRFSVGNISLETKPVIKRLDYEELILLYQSAINEVITPDDQKTLRSLRFHYEVQVKKTIPNSKQLFDAVTHVQRRSADKQIEHINRITQEILTSTFSPRYVYHMIREFIKQIQELAKEYATTNIPIYLEFGEQVKHASRRAQSST